MVAPSTRLNFMIHSSTQAVGAAELLTEFESTCFRRDKNSIAK